MKDSCHITMSARMPAWRWKSCRTARKRTAQHSSRVLGTPMNTRFSLPAWGLRPTGTRNLLGSTLRAWGSGFRMSHLRVLSQLLT